ncbi:MORN repeat-containing protein [Toxoplasma gondii VAND]|uniref:MORN repeat-containing protein n=1 Tax=Toxoplasma gondii VAND TaxID=933077 RepID=A0A086PSW3_TOXGO|nr:MORN repeat-containing protein [Toxoplasma gondii VAND]
MSPVAAQAARAARHSEKKSRPPEVPVLNLGSSSQQPSRCTWLGWCNHLRGVSSPLLGCALCLFLLACLAPGLDCHTRATGRRPASLLPLLSPAHAQNVPWLHSSFWTSPNGGEKLDKPPSTWAAWWPASAETGNGKKPTEAVDLGEAEQRVVEVPTTPAGFFFFPDSGDNTGKVNCSVEPATFPANAKDFVVQCPSTVQTATLLLLTRKEKRTFRIAGSSMSTSKLALHFPSAPAEAREVSLEICDEDGDASLSPAALSLRTTFSLFSLFSGPSSSSHSSSQARADSLTPLLSPPRPVAPSAVCRTVSILPVHLPGAGLAAPRLAQLAVSRGVKGVPALQPPFHSEILEYHATVPEAQAVTVAAVAAPGTFLTVAEEGSFPVPEANSKDPLVVSIQEHKTSLLHKLTCGDPGTVVRLVFSVFSSAAGEASLCSGGAKCVLNARVKKTLNAAKLVASGSEPARYRVYIHCMSPTAGHAALAGIQPTRGQLVPRIFSAEKHLYYLLLPSGVNGDKVTFRAADTQTEIFVGEEGRRRSSGVAENVPLQLALDEESRVVPIRTLAQKRGTRDEQDGELYFVVLARATEYPGSAADAVQPLLKSLNLLGAKLNRPFDPRAFHFSAEVPVDRKFVGLQLEEAVPGSHIRVDGNLFLPRHQTAFYRLRPGDTRRISIELSRPDSEVFIKNANGSPFAFAEKGTEKNKREVVYTIEVTRRTAWFTGASLVPLLAQAACWGSGIVHAFAGAGWLAVAKTLNFVAITAAIPGTPEMWTTFSSRFLDFGLQLSPPSNWIEAVDESMQGLAGPQLLPSAASPLGKLVPASFLGTVAAPVEASGTEQKSWAEVSRPLLRYLEIQSDRRELMNRFASCVLLYGTLLLVFVFLLALVLLRRLFERRHRAALDAFAAAPLAEGLQEKEGPPKARLSEPTKGLWRFLPEQIAVPTSVLIFLFDYGLVSFAQASAGLAFAEKTMSLRIFGVRFSPWCLSTVCSALLVLYPITYLVWVHNTLRFLKKKVVFCSALQKYTDRRVYEVKAWISRSSFLPPCLDELFSGELRSVVPIKAASGSGLSGVTVPLEAVDEADDEDASHASRRSFACGDGMALTANEEEQALAYVSSSSCEELSASCAQHYHASFGSALLPPGLQGPRGREEHGVGDAESGWYLGQETVEEAGGKGGTCLIQAREELRRQRDIAGHGEKEILLQLDGDAYEVHDYEPASANLCRQWPHALVGRFSVNLSGDSHSASSRSRALCTEAEIHLCHLSSLAWLSAGLQKPLHFWVPARGLQLSYADRFALLLPPSASGYPRELLHFLTVRGSLVGATLLLSLNSAFGVSALFSFALLLLACGLNLAVNLPAALHRSADRWQRRGFAGQQRESDGGEAMRADRELLADLAATRLLEKADAAEERTRFVAVKETQKTELRELRRWTPWNRCHADASLPAVQFWVSKAQRVVRWFLELRCWRSKAVFVATDLFRGLVGAELAKIALLVLLLSCNDRVGESQLHVSATLAGACLVVVALILPSTAEIRRAATAWTQWFDEMRLLALVGLCRASETLRNWRYYVHLTSFYCGLVAQWVYSVITANRRRGKPLNRRYPVAPVYITSEVNLPVQRLHVVVPETGLLFTAPVPQTPPRSFGNTCFFSSMSSLLSPKTTRVDYTPLSARRHGATDASSVCGVRLRKCLIRLGPVAQGVVGGAHLPVQIDASRLLDSLHGTAQGSCTGQLVATIQVVHKPNYRYPLYDKAFSALSSLLALTEQRRSFTWVRQVLNSTRLSSPSGAETDSYLSLYTDEALVPPCGSRLRNSLLLSSEEEERARTQAPKAVVEKLAAVVLFEAWGARRQLRILSDRIRLAHTYQVSSVGKRPTEAGGENTSAETIQGNDAKCYISGRLEVTLPTGTKPDLRGDILVVRQGLPPEEFVVNSESVAIQYDELLNRVLIKHRELQRGATYATRFFSCSAMVPPPSARVQATEKGRLIVPLPGNALPDLDNFLLLLSPEEQPGVIFVVDPALTDAHVCFIPALLLPPLASGALGSSSDNGKSHASNDCGGYTNAFISGCKGMVLRVLGSEEREQNYFLPPLPCTLLKELSDEADDEESDRGNSESLGTFRVAPNYKRQRLAFAAELNERDALLQDLLENGAVALPFVAEAVLSSSELMSFFSSRGIHTNGESRWINPLTDGEHSAVKKFSQELDHVKAALIDLLATRLDKEICYFQMLVEDLETLEKMHGDSILRDAVQEHDEAIEMCKGMEELSFLNTRMEHVRRERYKTRFFEAVSFPLELEGSAIALKPRLADQMRQWEEQLGLWLTGEIGATTEDANKGGPGRLEATVDSILQHAYKCLYSRSPAVTRSRESAASGSSVLPSPPPVLHFVVSSLTLCGGPSTWRPDPLPAHSAFVKLWERAEEEGEIKERAVWTPCFLKLTASALQFVFPHFIVRAPESPAKPEYRFLPLQFVKLCDLSVSAPSVLDSKEDAFDVGRARWGRQVEEESPQLRTQNLMLQFTTVEVHGATAVGNASTLVLPSDHLTRAAASWSESRKFFFFSSDDSQRSLVSVRASACHMTKWQTMLGGADMHKPKQLTDGCASLDICVKVRRYGFVSCGNALRLLGIEVLTLFFSNMNPRKPAMCEGRVRYVLPSFSASRRSASLGAYHLLFTNEEGELRARRGGAFLHPRLFSSSPLFSAFHKTPVAARCSQAAAASSSFSPQSLSCVTLAGGGSRVETRQEDQCLRGQFLETQKAKESAFYASSLTSELLKDRVQEEAQPAGRPVETHTPLDEPSVPLLVRGEEQRSDTSLKLSTDAREKGERDRSDGSRAPRDPRAPAGLSAFAAGELVREDAGEQSFYDHSTSPPKFLGRYVGEWSLSRYHGEGRLFNQRDRLVYDGTWANGRRWGDAVAYSKDTNGTWWKQLGTFVDDEMEGLVRLTIVDDASYGFDQEDEPRGATKDSIRILEIEGVVEAVHPGAEKPATATCLPAEASWTSERQPSITKEREAEYLPFRSKWDKLLGPSIDPEGQTLWDRLNRSFTRIKFVDGSEFFRALGGNALNGLIAGRLRTKHFVYEGSFVDGRAEGRGKIRSLHTGAEYEGEWRAGLRHGKGVLRLPRPTPGTQIVIAATFKDGFASCSSGKIDLERVSFEDTKEMERRVERDTVPFTSYVGGLHEGLPHGTGVMVFDNFIYEGDFFAGGRDGRGVVKDIRKKGLTRVDGPWKDDVPHGRVSRVVYPDDSIYGGDFVHGKREGHGIFMRNNMVVYDGLWRDDVPDGRGTLVNEEGTYEGEVCRGKRHGKGRFTFFRETTDAGEICFYEGDWDNDLPHGVGKLRSPCGKEGAFLFVRGCIDPNLKTKRADKGGGTLELPSVGCSPSISPNSAWWKAGTSRLNRNHLKSMLDDEHTRFGNVYESQTFAFGVTPKGCPLRSNLGVALPVPFPELLELNEDKGTPFVLRTPSGRRIS